MKDRIRKIRKDVNMNQTDFGAEIGATLAAYSKYETGKVIPDKTTRLLICEKFNVSETWLETGEGEPYREGLIPSLVHALRLMPDVKALLEAKLPKVSDATLRKMNDAFRAFIDDLK